MDVGTRIMSLRLMGAQEGWPERWGHNASTSGEAVCAGGARPWEQTPQGLCPRPPGTGLWPGLEGKPVKTGCLVAGADVGAVSLEKEGKQRIRGMKILVNWVSVFGRQSRAKCVSSVCTLSLQRPARAVLGCSARQCGGIAELWGEAVGLCPSSSPSLLWKSPASDAKGSSE